MRLILETPALQAHSVHQYDKWRMIITHYVARRHGVTAEHLLPRTAGHATLALAISAYEHWLSQQGATLADLLGMIDESLAALRHHLAH
jgi:hypothetical protein